MKERQPLIRFDWAMKTILRDKANFDILEGFLMALLKQEVTVLEILESESNNDDPEQKFTCINILIQDKKKFPIIIKLQNYYSIDYLEQILLNTSQTVIDNIQIDLAYRKIKKIISINILYFDIDLGNDYVFHGNTHIEGVYINQPLLYDIKQEDNSFKELSAKELFPEYYIINVKRFADIIKTDLDEWIYVFKHSTLPKNYHAKNLNKMEEKLSLLQMTQEERHSYELYVLDQINEQDQIETATRKGKQEGMKQGKQEEKIAIAKSLLDVLDIKTIALNTGLSIEKIQRLNNA